MGRTRRPGPTPHGFDLQEVENSDSDSEGDVDSDDNSDGDDRSDGGDDGGVGESGAAAVMLSLDQPLPASPSYGVGE